MTDRPSRPIVRSSSGLFASSLNDARESVVRWLERARKSGMHDLPEAVCESVARVATLAVNDTLKGVYSAGVAAGRVAVCLALGITPPNGPEQVHCPHCGSKITAL